MTRQSFSSVSICDRLKQRYGNNAQNWQSSLQDDIRQKSARDTEFIRYIVNFVIEQAKHNIVISELPDVIRTLHHEAATIVQNNRMITLEEAISQVQTIGALKYPYLKKVKPVSTEDFVKEVTREVLDRLGSLITLDMIENICQFTTCSTKQLLHAMPAIDVNEAATLISEDISRNQHEKKNHLKHIDTINTAVLRNSIEDKSFLASSSPARVTNGIVDVKLQGMSKSLSKERDSSRSIQNLNHSYERTKLTTPVQPPTIKKKSKSPRNKNTNQHHQLNEQVSKSRSDEVASARVKRSTNIDGNVKATSSIKPTDVDQHLERSNNDRSLTAIDSDSCPLEVLLNQRFKQQKQAT